MTDELAKTVVKDESSSVTGSARSEKSSSGSTAKVRESKESQKTQEYVRTESVVSLKDIR